MSVDQYSVPRPWLRRGDTIAALSALLLLAAMFLMDWYGVVELPCRATAQSKIVTAVNAWHALSTLRWLMLLTIAVALGSAAIHVSQRSHGNMTDSGMAVAALGSVTSALLVYRVLIEFPRSNEVVDQKLGALLGLLCALCIALGGYELLRAERAHARQLIQRSRARVASGRTAR